MEKVKIQKSKVEKKDTAKKAVKVLRAEKESKEVKTTKESSASAKATADKKEKNVVEKPVSVVSDKKTKSEGLHIDVFNMLGKVSGTITLPAEIFATKINAVLMSQAVRVYLANQRQGNASTKTRGEVVGSTRKIYRQKGTGRARHGGLRAPIFVKGGIAHGPKPQDHSLTMSQKMRRVALLSALSAKAKDNEIKILDGLQDVEMKTKLVAKTLQHMQLKNKVLLVMPEHIEKVYRAARNIDKVSVTAANRLTTYDILEHKTILFMKDAISTIERIWGKEKAHGS